MTYQEQKLDNNIRIRERYELIMERCRLIHEETTYNTGVSDYFHKVSDFLMLIEHLVSVIEQHEFDDYSIEELQQYNRRLYEDILEENYASSYANPDYAKEQLGGEFGSILCFLYTEIRGLIPAAYEQKLFTVTVLSELFVEIYNLFEDEESFAEGKTFDQIIDAIYYYFFDYCEVFVEERVLEQISPDANFAVEIIMNADFTDLSYLYSFGEYIGSNEIATANYLNSLSQDQIDSMAATYTSGFYDGFVNNRIDISKKKRVNIRYTIGFERMVKAAILQFKEMGLEPVIYRAAVSVINKKQHLKIGYFSTSPNRQYDYDHRFDNSLYLNKDFMERKLACLRTVYEKYKAEASVYAGPAVIEIFGEKEFEPTVKESALALSKEQEKLSIEYNSQASQIINQYIPRDEYSFTIIAYPIADIGADYQDIFQDTVTINTLDKELYQSIQQKIINELDKGEYVQIRGRGENKTDLKVMLHELKNPEKETKFENCLADVNIPVGEVFTSPKLIGTEGILNVSEVYLNELKYVNLSLIFRDGMIADYTCDNFDSHEENKKFIKENLMYNRDTLPMGEFAIGTNTTAYAMAKKYDILYQLPILIVEKMGPHFAVGDTCYSMSEENPVFNPDGKEMVAKDNECSILRHTNRSKAYYNCHTDITIPYGELGDIIVVTKDNIEIPLIRDGLFVLPGTEELNQPLK